MKRLKMFTCTMLVFLMVTAFALGGCGGTPAEPIVTDTPGDTTESASTEEVFSSTWYSVDLLEDLAYAVGEACVYAMNVDTGAESWRFTGEGDVLWYNVGLDAEGESLVVLCSDLYSLDPQTGEELWRFIPDDDVSIWSAPAIVDRVVCFFTTDGYLQAVDLATGKWKWQFMHRDPGELGDSIGSAPAVAGSLVYVMDTEGRVVALDSATGKQGWVSELAPEHPWLYAWADGVCCITEDGSVIALDAQTGNALWTLAPKDSSSTYSAPAYDGIVVVEGDGYLRAVEASTGKDLWDFDPGLESWGCRAFADGEMVCLSMWSPDYYSGDVALIGLDKQSGREIWRLDAAVGQYPDTICMVNGKICYPGTDGRVHAIVAATGQE